MKDKVVHLWRNVCDACMMWCEGTIEGKKIGEIELSGMEEGVMRICEVTCLECLKIACAFGDVIRIRREELGRQK
jgi:hypothetical protein